MNSTQQRGYALVVMILLGCALTALVFFGKQSHPESGKKNVPSPIEQDLQALESAKALQQASDVRNKQINDALAD